MIHALANSTVKEPDNLTRKLEKMNKSSKNGGSTTTHRRGGAATQNETSTRKKDQLNDKLYGTLPKDMATLKEELLSSLKRPPQKSVVTTYILWLFGGFFGAHHIYLHRDRHAFVWWCTLGMTYKTLK